MSDPWLKFWVGDWRSSSRIRQLSMEKRGVLLELILADHESDGVTDSWPVLRLELPSQARRKIVLEVLYAHFVQCEDGKWRNPKRLKNIEISVKRSIAGRKGAAATNKRTGNFAAASAAANAPASAAANTPANDAAKNSFAAASAAAQNQNQNQRTTQKTTKHCRAGQRDRFVDQVQRVIDHYRTHHPRSAPKARSGTKRYRLVRDRLAEGYTVDQLVEAIDGYHRSPWHCGENERGSKYLSLDLILRDADHVQAGLEMVDIEAPAAPERQASIAWASVIEWLQLSSGSRPHVRNAGFSEQIHQAVRASGGWNKLVEADRWTMSKARQDFEAAYQDHQKNAHISIVSVSSSQTGKDTQEGRSSLGDPLADETGVSAGVTRSSEGDNGPDG